MTFELSFILADAAAAPPPQSPFSMLVPFACIGVIFYFLIFRPQQKKQKERNRTGKMVVIAHVDFEPHSCRW